MTIKNQLIIAGHRGWHGVLFFLPGYMTFAGGYLRLKEEFADAKSKYIGMLVLSFFMLYYNDFVSVYMENTE